MHPLVVEAMKKAAVAWLGIGDRVAYPVWCCWVDDALFVVSGPDEQPAPGLTQVVATAARETTATAQVAEPGATPGATPTVTVTTRGSHGGRIVTWLARANIVPADSELWQTVVPHLASKRLNSVPAATLVERWRRDATVVRLVPTDEPLVVLPDGALAAPPVATAAVRPARKPFRLHRVRRRRDR